MRLLPVAGSVPRTICLKATLRISSCGQRPPASLDDRASWQALPLFAGSHSLSISDVGRLGKVHENRLHLVRDTTIRCIEPYLIKRQIGLIARCEVGRDEVILALEMVIERLFGDPGFLCHGIDTDARMPS